jgi:predicted amidophosphoribosyltransferase
MNSGTIALSTDDGKKQPLSPIRIAGPCFEGWALSPHLEKMTARSGAVITRRSAFAETMYRYRYQGDGSLLPMLAGCFASSAQALFPGKNFSGLLMVPPPITRADYGPVVALVTEISRLMGIPLLQFAVRDNQEEPPKRSERAFDFSSPAASAVFAGKQVLVIDDIYRSGRSLNRFCSLIKNGGGAAEVMALVGTAVRDV